jgi:hypothetical protein
VSLQVPDDVYDSELARFAGLVNSLKASGVAGARELEENSPLKKVVSASSAVCVSSYALGAFSKL